MNELNSEKKKLFHNNITMNVHSNITMNKHNSEKDTLS